MKNVLGFEDFINESVGVITRRYERSHGKKPRGGSHWAFYFDDIGGDPIFAPGRMNYADAVKWAKEEAKKAGKTMVYVGESVVKYETFIFDIIEPEFNNLKDKLDSLKNNTADLKWKKALDKIQSDLEKLEFLIGRYDRQLGVIPMDESSINERVSKIACIECDEVNTAQAWKKNNGFCPSCKVSTQGVAESVIDESINIKDIGVGTVLNFKDGETWKVTKVIGNVSNPRGFFAKPHDENTKKANTSIEIELTPDFLKKELASINEATTSWSKMMKGVKASESGPWSLVAIENGKVVAQKIDIKIKDSLPAHYEAMRKEFPRAKIHIEDGTGMIVWTEKYN